MNVFKFFTGKGTDIKSLELFTFIIQFRFGYSIEIMNIILTTLAVIIISAYIVLNMSQAQS